MRFFFRLIIFFRFQLPLHERTFVPITFYKKDEGKTKTLSWNSRSKIWFLHCCVMIIFLLFLWHFFHGGRNNFLKWKSTSTFEVTNEFLCLLVCVTPLKVAKMLGKVWHVLIISGFFHSLIWDHLGTAYQTFFNSIYLTFTN